MIHSSSSALTSPPHSTHTRVRMHPPLLPLLLLSLPRLPHMRCPNAVASALVLGRQQQAAVRTARWIIFVYLGGGRLFLRTQQRRESEVLGLKRVWPNLATQPGYLFKYHRGTFSRVRDASVRAGRRGARRLGGLLGIEHARSGFNPRSAAERRAGDAGRGGRLPYVRSHPAHRDNRMLGSKYTRAVRRGYVRPHKRAE